MPGPLFVLGPQSPEPNLEQALSRVPGDGRVVLIHAGWRHEEPEIDHLRLQIGEGCVLLPLYAWFEELLRNDPDGFGDKHRRQQEALRKLKNLYRMRLRPALETVRNLLGEEEDPQLTAPELEDALEVVRHLDQRFLDRSEAIRQRFLGRFQPMAHPAVAARHQAAAQLIAGARAVVIAGGHVAVLRSRMALFRIGGLLKRAHLEGTGIIAWSAGAMTLTERVVLFHDDPPMGLHDAEVLDGGWGLVPGVVLLPHARERLALDDQGRVGMMASRFVPRACIGLENGAWLAWEGGELSCLGDPGAAFQLGSDGYVTPLEAARAQGA